MSGIYGGKGWLSIRLRLLLRKRLLVVRVEGDSAAEPPAGVAHRLDVFQEVGDGGRGLRGIELHVDHAEIGGDVDGC